MSSVRNIHMRYYLHRVIGLSVHGKRLRKLISTRYGMTVNRTRMTPARVAVVTVNMTGITVESSKASTRIPILCRARKLPSRSNGSNNRASNLHLSSRKHMRNTFMGRNIGTTLQTMKIWVQLYYQ